MTPALELAIRAAAVALALAAALAWALRPGRAWARGWGAIALGGIAAFGVASSRGGIQALGLALFPFNAWCLATPFAVWMLAREVFGEETRAPPGDRYDAAWLAGFGAYAALASATDWGRFALGPLGAWPEAAAWLFDGVRAGALVLLGAACALAIRHWRGDLVEVRRRTRAAFLVVISAVFMALAGSEWVFGPQGASLEARTVGLGVLVLLALTLLQLVARGLLDPLLAELPARSMPALVVAPPAVRLAPVTSGVEAALARRVVDEMQARQLWKRERLGIAALAAELRTQEYLLRRAINGQLGYRNFNDFLHDWRLREAADRLASPRERHLPVLSIALDCGYGSIGPFNRAFKARFGVTPTQYRHLRESEGPHAVSGIG